MSLTFDFGLSVTEASHHLSISQQTLRTWIKKRKSVGLTSSGSPSVTDLEAENSLHGKELAGPTGEGNPKKALAYLAKKPRGALDD